MPDWLANNAAPIFSQMLVKTNNKIDAAIAANDNIAGAVIATLKAKHLQPIPLSGQDASAQGVQYILAGWQTGTVYKYVPDEANAAAAAAVALIKGKKPKSNTTTPNGKKKEPTLAIPDRLDHEGELQAALHRWIPEEEPGLRRRRTSSTASKSIDRRWGRRFGVPTVNVVGNPPR